LEAAVASASTSPGTEIETETETDGSILTTAPNDPRFPNTNQTRACWQYYVDAHKCALAKAEVGGVEHPGCKKLTRLARIMCPASWIEKWDEALEQGINPSSIEMEKI
jgi:cytochrome c oxidase subunit 6b